MTEAAARDDIARVARSLFQRGLTFGSSGNISVRLEDGFLMTPTGVSMGEVDPARISRLDLSGQHIDGDPPTKETVLHMAMYASRPRAGAVLHTHSTYSVAISCLSDVDPQNALPPLTAYYVMRVGVLPIVPFFPPGDADLAQAVGVCAEHHHAMLMANHGPIVAGVSLDEALYALEELEETAKLFLLLRGAKTAPLSPHQVQDVQRRYPVRA